MEKQSRFSGWLLPGAILFGGVVLAISLFVTRYHATVSTDGDPAAARAVSTADHVLGNPAAPVVVIEYSDIDSEYAKDFQQVMEQVVQNYSANGSVAWVFRHFPQASNDPNAEQHAEAAECVGAEGGTHDFFAFIDAIQKTAPGDNLFDPKGYDVLVHSLGLNTDAFDSCLSGGTYKKQVAADYQNALAVGATGSPYSIIEVTGQKPIVVSGSVPYATMKQIIVAALTKQLNSK